MQQYVKRCEADNAKEITAIPELLGTLDAAIDAVGWQKQIAEKGCGKGAGDRTAVRKSP